MYSFSTSVIKRFENAMNGVVIKQKFQRKNIIDKPISSQSISQFNQPQQTPSQIPSHQSPNSLFTTFSQQDSLCPPTSPFTSGWNGYSANASTFPSQSHPSVLPPFYPPQPSHPSQPPPNHYLTQTVQQQPHLQPMPQIPITPVNLPHQSNQPIGSQMSCFPATSSY